MLIANQLFQGDTVLLPFFRKIAKVKLIFCDCKAKLSHTKKTPALTFKRQTLEFQAVYHYTFRTFSVAKCSNSAVILWNSIF